MARQKHALDGEKVSGQKDENELVAPVGKQPRSTRPPFNQAVHIIVLRIALDQRRARRERK
jgi:hypothetical protein